MGAVWLAQDELLGRAVAIKQLLLQPGLEESDAEEARQRTMREGRIAARLHHPNAITVFDVVTDDHGQPCLIMEYLESTSLAAVLQREKTLPPLEVAAIGKQIAAALKAAHRVGIVHRDIKPGNILLTDDGLVKLTDFGISRAKDDVSVTKTGMIAGTPAYLAPEVAIGQEPGPESDIFSLGSTLYAATEGQPPFGLSENTLSLLHAVAAGNIHPPRQSGPLTSLLAVLLHPDKTHRPDAEEAEELLDAIAHGETPLGGPVEEHDSDATMLAAGAAGAAAAAGAAGASGTQYLDEATLAHSDGSGVDADGYPAEDYDERGYGADGYAEDDDATRMVAAPPGPYDDEGERAPAWKRSAAVIGGLVFAGLAALGIWLFTSSGAEEDKTQPPPVVETTSETSEETTTTTTTEVYSSVSEVAPPVQSTEVEPTSEEVVPTEEPPSVEPEPTEEPTLTEEPEPEPTDPPSSESSVTTASDTQSSVAGR